MTNDELKDLCARLDGYLGDNDGIDLCDEAKSAIEALMRERNAYKKMYERMLDKPLEKYVAVPREPTGAMLEAGAKIEIPVGYGFCDVDYGCAEDVYKAMLAASEREDENA